MRSNDWPDTITTGELTRVVSQHLREETHRDITPERVEYVLENWATKHWNNKNLDYFDTHYQNLEVRDES